MLGKRALDFYGSAVPSNARDPNAWGADLPCDAVGQYDAASTDDLAAFAVASRMRKSWLYPKNALASCNHDVVELVRRAVATPHLVVTGGRSRAISFDLGGSEQQWKEIALSCYNDVFGHTCVSLPGGFLFFAGGCGTDVGNAPIAECNLYSHRKREAFSAVSLSAPLLKHCSVTNGGGDVYVLGGWVHRDEHLHRAREVHVLRANTSTWTPCAPFASAMVMFACAYDEHTNTILAVGGVKNEHCEQYDCVVDRWTARASLPYEIWGPRGVMVNNEFVVVAGESQTLERGDPPTHTFKYDSRPDEWRRASPPLIQVVCPGATVLDNHSIVLLGGERRGNHYGKVTRNAQVYDSRADKWRLESRWMLPSGRAWVTLATVQ